MHVELYVASSCIEVDVDFPQNGEVDGMSTSVDPETDPVKDPDHDLSAIQKEVEISMELEAEEFKIHKSILRVILQTPSNWLRTFVPFL